MGDFINVQNLSIPEEGSQFIVTNTYTVSFYNPYEMFVSSWNPASDNTISLIWYDKDGYSHSNPGLKDQVVIKGQNTFSFRLADYNLDSNNISGVGILLNAYVVVNGNGDALYFTSSKSLYKYEKPIFYTACGAPTSPAVSATLSRGAVKLSWGAGSAGTNNSVTGYDVEHRESSDGSSWGSWATVSDSPVTGTSLDVTPPGTAGNYYQYRVRTRGSAGSDYYSGWVTSTNTLRRKWDAFGAWTDSTLTAGVSSIRAVHLTQLQERIAAIRAFYGLSAYSFTAVTARKTKIATWAALIGELRSAIDGITTNHAAWNTLEAGKPRIAHITQLRDIIDNM